MSYLVKYTTGQVKVAGSSEMEARRNFQKAIPSKTIKSVKKWTKQQHQRL